MILIHKDMKIINFADQTTVVNKSRAELLEVQY